MKILIKKALVYDRESPFHNQRMDVLVENGLISEIANEIQDKNFRKIHSENLCISPGWLDIGSFNGEPGFEYREDLISLKKAAAKGGYTYLATFPNTNPPIDNKVQIDYLKKKNDQHAVEIWPVGSITKKAEGKDLAEILDQKSAGVVGFSDGFDTNLNKDQLLRALLYTKACQTRLIIPLVTRARTNHGQINESSTSVALGMVGLPKVDEEISIMEVGHLAKYSECQIHFHNVSTRESLEILKKDKSGLFSGSIPYLNLIYTDIALMDFNEQLKVLPPLREESDRKALIKAINQKQINVINSNHMPLSAEEKNMEFEQAHFGAIGLETCFAGVNSFVKEIDLEVLVHCLSKGSYKALDIGAPKIDINEKCIVTLFDPDLEFEYSLDTISSKSKNSPFLGKVMKGQVVGIINGIKISLNEYS